MFFTKEKQEYARYLRESATDPTTVLHNGDAYAYCMYDKLLLRSQLDCMHPALPRKSFDIKTRATIAVRMNSRNYEEFRAYRLDKVHGLWNSFTREYYDMMRSAFLKYSFQVRIGNMDGLFVAYHNTAEIFGFQYVSREEMDFVLFGNSRLGDQYFQLSLGILSKILTKAAKKWPGSPIRIILATRNQNMMSVFAERLPLVENVKTMSPTEMPEDADVVKWNIGAIRLINGQMSTEAALLEGDVLDIISKVQEPIGSSVNEYVALRSRLMKKMSSFADHDPSAYSQFLTRFFNAKEEDDDEPPAILGQI